MPPVVGLRLEGPKITRVAVYNLESGKWSPLDLDEPASGVVQPIALGPGAVAYQVGRFVYVYRTKTSTWDRLDVDADDKQDAACDQGPMRRARDSASSGGAGGLRRGGGGRPATHRPVGAGRTADVVLRRPNNRCRRHRLLIRTDCRFARSVRRHRHALRGQPYALTHTAVVDWGAVNQIRVFFTEPVA